MPAQGEDLDAGQRRLGILEILALALGDPGDRPEHDRRRDRELDEDG